MEFIRRAKYIAGNYSLLSEHSHFNISSRMISNSRFAEAIIGKYMLPDEYDLPPVSYVYYDPAFVRDEGEQLILLSSYLMTLNHFHVSMFHTAYENHFYRAVKLQCQQLFLALNQSLPWQSEVRELREIYQEIASRQNEAQNRLEISGTGEETLHRQTEEDRQGQAEEGRQGQTEEGRQGQTEDRQGQEAANRRLLAVKKRTERTLAFMERQEETRFPDRSRDAKRTSKPAVGTSVQIGMGQGRMAASSWKSEQAKAFFWRVQRSSAWEQNLLLQAAEVTSLVGLMKLLQRMEPERWRREVAKLRERLEVMAASGEFEKALEPETRKTEEIWQDFLRETRMAVTYLEKEEWETFIGELIQKRAQFSEETDGPLFQWLEEHAHLSETKENISLSEEKRSFLLALSRQVERDAAVRAERMENRRQRIARQFPGSASGQRLSELTSGQRLLESAPERHSELTSGRQTIYSEEARLASEKRLLYKEVMEAVSYLDQNEWNEFREELFQYHFHTAGKLLDVLDAEKSESKTIPDAEAQDVEKIQTLSPVLQWIREKKGNQEETASFGEEKLSFLNAMSEELERLEQSKRYRQDAGLDLLLQESRVLGTYVTWRTEEKTVPELNPSESTPGHHPSEIVPERQTTDLAENMPVSEKRLLYEEVMEAVSYLDQNEWNEFREELFQYRFRTAGKLLDVLDAKKGEPETTPDAEAKDIEEIQTLSPVLQWIREQRENREETTSFGEEKLSFLNAMSGELERLEQSERYRQEAGLDLLLQESRVLGTYMTWRTDTKAVPEQHSSETVLEYPSSESASENPPSEATSGHHLSEIVPERGTTDLTENMPASEKRLLYEEVMEAVSYLDQNEWNEFREELFQYGFRTAGKLLDVLDTEMDAENGEPETTPDVEAKDIEEIQTLSPVLQWIRERRENREETTSFGEEKLSFLNAMSGELEHLEQSEGNQEAGLDLLLQESRVLGTYMTWRTDTKAVPGQHSSEIVLEHRPSEPVSGHHLSEIVPERGTMDLAENMPASEKRLLYEEVMEAVSYLDQNEWNEFREELFQYRFRTAGKLLDVLDTEMDVEKGEPETTPDAETKGAEEIQTLSPILQWIRERRENQEETASFGEEKLSFLNAMSGELERMEQAERYRQDAGLDLLLQESRVLGAHMTWRTEAETKDTEGSLSGEQRSRLLGVLQQVENAGTVQREIPDAEAGKVEEFQALSPILRWISRQGISGQRKSIEGENGQRESRQGESSLWQEDGSEGNGSELVYRVQSRLEELISPNGKTKRMVPAPGTPSSLPVRNLWMQAAKGEETVLAFGTVQEQVRPAGLETALEMVEQLRTKRLRTERLGTGGSKVLEEAEETVPSSYRPASLVITQTGAGRGKRAQEADEGIAASLNTKIETEVVRQVKEQVTDIQFISKSGEVRDDQTAAHRESIKKLTEQLERQQQELEMLRGRQSLVYENPGISKLSKSVIRKVQSQINQERMRRGI